MAFGPSAQKKKQTAWVNDFLTTFHQEPFQPLGTNSNPSTVKGPPTTRTHLSPSNSSGVIPSEAGDPEPRRTTLRSILAELETTPSCTQPAKPTQEVSPSSVNRGPDSVNGAHATASTLAVDQSDLRTTSGTGKRGMWHVFSRKSKNLAWNHSASVAAEGIQEIVQSSDSQFGNKTALVNALSNIFLWEYNPSAIQSKLHPTVSTSSDVHCEVRQITTATQPVVPYDVAKILQKSSALNFDTDTKLNQLLKSPTSALQKRDLLLPDSSSSTNAPPKSFRSPPSLVHSRSHRTNYEERCYPTLDLSSRRGAMVRSYRCSRAIRKRPPARKSSSPQFISVEKRKQLLDRWLGLEGNQ
ncbi:hypothetical protein IWQ61_007652 [Dispira simplex]|nr:hypothetical protein IWQ61_007652 [Dispira simplex]